MPLPFASPDRLLAHFARTGDPRSLGRLFDRTAAELLRVAGWICGNRTDAEDLLQRTFLTVLTSRERFDPSRRALPWLCGILANHGRKLQEDRARRTEGRMPAGERDPAALAADGEFAAAVARVRAQLGSPYAEVLDLHLAEGLDAKAIAARLGRPAGTVRTQIVRGLARLRRELPGGFVAGLVLAATATAANLAAQRAALVARAQTALPAGAATGAATLGGMLMTKKFAWILPVLLLAFGGGAVWLQQQEPGVHAPSEPPPPAVAALPTAPPTTMSRDTTQQEARREPAPEGDDVHAEPGLATLVVRLVWADDGSPAAHVGILAKPQPGSLLTERERLTDARGRVVLRGLPPGRCFVTSSFTGSEQIELAATTVTTLDLEARRTGMLDGLVVDAAQQPIANARIWLSLGTVYRGFEVGQSDAHGRFRVPFVATQDIGARKAGYAPSRLVGLGKASREVTLVLAAAGGTIRGRVVDRDQRAVPGARIEIGAPGGRNVTSDLLERLMEPTAAKLVADDAGAFTCEGVAVGEVACQAWAPGFGPTSQPVVVDAGRISDVTLMLLPGAVVAGTVCDAAGRPVPGATVDRVGAFYEFARPRTETAADGTFRLGDLPAAAVTLRAVGANGSVEATLTTAPGATTTWNAVIPPDGLLLSGRIVDPTGQGVAGLLVGILPAASTFANPTTRTDAAGTFHLRGLDKGTHTLQVERDEACLARREITVPGSAPLVVTLAADEMPTAHVRGRVVDEAGAGVAATLLLRLPSWRRVPATDTDVDGTFARGPLPPGGYLVDVAARGFGTTHLGLVALRPGEHTTMPDIVLRRAGRVELQLVGADPAPGTTVQIARRDGVMTTWVKPDGGRAEAELPPGEYLAVVHVGTARAGVHFVVRTAETTPAALTFAPAAAVTLTCPRADATPNDLLHVTVHDAAGALVDCVHLHPGIEPATWRTLLPPGDYTVTVAVPDGRRATTPFTVRDLRETPPIALARPHD